MSGLRRVAKPNVPRHQQTKPSLEPGPSLLDRVHRLRNEIAMLQKELDRVLQALEEQA